AGTAQPERGGVDRSRLLARVGKEHLEGRELARGGDVADAAGTPTCELRAQVGGAEAGEGGPVLGARLVEKPRRRGDIGTHGMRRAAAIGRKVPAPLLEQLGRAHAAARASGTSSPSSASSSGMPLEVAP